jgi:quinol monooxygenase YgiN
MVKNMMEIVHVHVNVKKEYINQFIDATLENAKNSVLEPGIARFDVIQDQDDDTKFILVEVYRNQAAQAAHKETEHYKKWRDTVANMMAEPRTSKKFKNYIPK